MAVKQSQGRADSMPRCASPKVHTYTQWQRFRTENSQEQLPSPTKAASLRSERGTSGVGGEQCRPQGQVYPSKGSAPHLLILYTPGTKWLVFSRAGYHDVLQENSHCYLQIFPFHQFTSKRPQILLNQRHLSLQWAKACHPERNLEGLHKF